MNVKQGDLAIIIRGKHAAGHIVKIVEYDGHSATEGDMWWVKLTSPIPVINSKTGERRVRPAGSECICPDSWLKPISGLQEESSANDHIPESNPAYHHA